jgi:hypothetical protein
MMRSNRSSEYFPANRVFCDRVNSQSHIFQHFFSTIFNTFAIRASWSSQGQVYARSRCKQYRPSTENMSPL